MAAVVSTRILRLQAISPRLLAVAPADVSAITPYESLLRYDSVNHVMQLWNGTAWVNFINQGGIYSIAVPTQTLDSAAAIGVSVGSGLGDINIYSITPPDLALDALVPGVSVLVTSP